jgi:hypothetical protein
MFNENNFISKYFFLNIQFISLQTSKINEAVYFFQKKSYRISKKKTKIKLKIFLSTQEIFANLK